MIFLSKMQNKILLMLILATIIPVSIIGWYGTFNSTTALTESALNQINYGLTYNAEKIEYILGSIDKDVLFLSKMPPLQTVINVSENNLSYQESVNQLTSIFLDLIQVKHHYTQLRYLDENGKEVARVDSDGVHSKVVPPSELQNKSTSEYFIKTMQLKAGEVYVSPINLNREKGQVEVPHKPVIRYSTPIYANDGQNKGIVVANVFAKVFLEPVKDFKPFEGSKTYLVNSDGYYLYHPDEAKEWGFDLKNNNKIEQDYPANVAKAILSGDKGDIYEGLPQIIGYQKISVADKYPIILISESPKSVVFASINSFKIIAGIIIILCMTVILSVELFIVKKLLGLMRGLVHSITSFSNQIASTMAEQERITAQQAVSVNQTTTTMGELNASSQKSAEQAVMAASQARQALVLVDGSVQLEESLQVGATSLKDKVRQIADKIKQLSEHTNQISNITNLVSDLANQTNMLSLNAAVEAVRAGSNGKGFAVISSEIRKLAGQSKKSLEQINSIVTDIQNATKLTVIVTEEGRESVNNIVGSINNIVVNNQQISLTANQQAVAIQQVVEAMNKLNAAAKETAAGISQTKLGTEQLNQSALNLKELVR